jgi:predicted glycogen debranching enzyme
MTTPPPPGTIRLDAATCTRLDESESREWLLADGLGGYASGTVAGTPTRRYHGLLLAATDPPAGRTLLVHSVHERVLLGARTIELDTNRWTDGTVAPRGYEHLVGFELEGRTPTWTWAVEGIRLQRRIALEEGVLEVRWSVPDDAHPLHLQYEVIVSNRSHHALLHAGSSEPPTTDVDGNHASVTWSKPGEGGVEGPLHLRADGTLMARDGWWRGFRLAEETARGFDDLEDGWHALSCTVEIRPGHPATFHAARDPDRLQSPIDLIERARTEDERITRAAGTTVETLHGRLALAADQFIARRPLPGGGSGATILAGYPWFADWGRDTMISLPGLALTTGRHREAASILKTFSDHEADGLIPNLFPDDGTAPKYNTVDASLFFIEAVRRWFAATGDQGTLRTLWSTVRSIITHYTEGTRHGIGVDPKDGLLRAGEVGVQLTWMDARVGDRVITPRMGKPVEINALWHAALCTAGELATTLGEDPTPFEDAAKRTRAGFERFWNPLVGALFDVLDGPSGDDDSIRPNQLLAISLDRSILDPTRARSTLEVVEETLLVPLGLRTLAPGSPEYTPRYVGGPVQRDEAYHQGTAWPWLLGPWLAANRAVDPHRAARIARNALDQAASHLSEAGLGSVSEILDATAPFTPRGCFAQAWSVAAILEIIDRADPDDAADGETNR